MNDRKGSFNRGGLGEQNHEIFDNRAPQEAMDELRRLNRDERRVESLMLAMRLIKEYPDDKILYSNAAMTMTKLGEQAQELGDENSAMELWASSLQYSMSGLKIDPNDRRMLTQTAKTFRQLGEYENSESFYLRAIRVDDQDKFTWTGMGDLYVRWGNEGNDITDEDYDRLMQDAIDCYEEAFAIDPSDKIIWRKMDELRAEGYERSEDGYDIGDSALDIINGAELVKPDEFRFPVFKPAARTLDM